MQFSRSSYHFIPLRSKYSPQHPARKHFLVIHRLILVIDADVPEVHVASIIRVYMSRALGRVNCCWPRELCNCSIWIWRVSAQRNVTTPTPRALFVLARISHEPRSYPVGLQDQNLYIYTWTLTLLTNLDCEDVGRVCLRNIASAVHYTRCTVWSRRQWLRDLHMFYSSHGNEMRLD
jgi:hypothetical protein